MHSDGRLFQRYKVKNPNIKIYAFDKNSNFYRFPIIINDLSFSGISLTSDIEFSNEKFILIVGKRVIKFKGKKSWSTKGTDKYTTGLQLQIEDERSFIYWSTLLQVLCKEHEKETFKTKQSIPSLSFSNIDHI